MTDGRIAANKLRVIDISGIKYNRLTAIEYDSEISKWKCSCDCGNIVYARSSVLKNGNTKSCGCLQKEKASKSAKTLSAKIRISKGCDPLVKLSKHEVRYRAYELSKSVFVRDNYCCVWCSQVGGKLNAHHLIPWSKSKELRYDLDNIVTLCRDCHLKIHNNNFHSEVNMYMTILIQGYIAVRKELT